MDRAEQLLTQSVIDTDIAFLWHDKPKISKWQRFINAFRRITKRGKQ